MSEEAQAQQDPQETTVLDDQQGQEDQKPETKLESKQVDSEELKEFKKWKDSKKTLEQRHAEELELEKNARAEAEKKANMLEQKNACLSAGVNPEFVDDVVALAATRINEKTDVKTAVKQVLEKYPHFSGKEKTPSITTSTNTHSDSASLTDKIRRAMGIEKK